MGTARAFDQLALVDDSLRRLQTKLSLPLPEEMRPLVRHRPGYGPLPGWWGWVSG